MTPPTVTPVDPNASVFADCSQAGGDARDDRCGRCDEGAAVGGPFGASLPRGDRRAAGAGTDGRRASAREDVIGQWIRSWPLRTD